MHSSLFPRGHRSRRAVLDLLRPRLAVAVTREEEEDAARTPSLTRVGRELGHSLHCTAQIQQIQPVDLFF